MINCCICKTHYLVLQAFNQHNSSWRSDISLGDVKDAAPTRKLSLPRSSTLNLTEINLTLLWMANHALNVVLVGTHNGDLQKASKKYDALNNPMGLLLFLAQTMSDSDIPQN